MIKIKKNFNKKYNLGLKDSPIQYIEKTSLACFDNSTESIKIYVLLAKRIQTVNNQTITKSDLVNKKKF